MFESNQTLVPEIVLYCKTLFMQHTSLLLGPATFWEELVVSIIISFVSLSWIYKKTFYCKYHLHRTQHTLTKILCWVWLLKPSSLKSFGRVLILQAQVVSLGSSCRPGDCTNIAFVVFQSNSNFEKGVKECVSSFPFYMYHYSFWISVKNVYDPTLG